MRKFMDCGAWIEEELKALTLYKPGPQGLYAETQEDDGYEPYGQGDVDSFVSILM